MKASAADRSSVSDLLRRTRSRKVVKKKGAAVMLAGASKVAFGVLDHVSRNSWDRFDAGYQTTLARYETIIDSLEELGFRVWSTHDGMATYVATPTHVGRLALRRWPSGESDFRVIYRTGGIEAIDLTEKCQQHSAGQSCWTQPETADVDHFK